MGKWTHNTNRKCLVSCLSRAYYIILIRLGSLWWKNKIFLDNILRLNKFPLHTSLNSLNCMYNKCTGNIVFSQFKKSFTRFNRASLPFLSIAGSRSLKQSNPRLSIHLVYVLLLKNVKLYKPYNSQAYDGL